MRRIIFEFIIKVTRISWHTTAEEEQWGAQMPMLAAPLSATDKPVVARNVLLTEEPSASAETSPSTQGEQDCRET